MNRRVVLSFVLALAVGAVPAQEPAPHGHDATIHHSFDDVERWVKTFDDPARDAWQKPEKVVRFLRVSKGQRVADLGAGTGYFTEHLAKAVGDGGKVYAVDIEPKLVDYLRERAAKAKWTQVVPVLAEPDDPRLPAGALDLVLICDTWHHIDDRLRYLTRLAATLAPGGRVAVVDFHEGDLPVGPPAGHKLSRGAVVKEFEEAGWRLADEYEKLPYQYVLAFVPGALRGESAGP